MDGVGVVTHGLAIEKARGALQLGKSPSELPPQYFQPGGLLFNTNVKLDWSILGGGLPLRNETAIIGALGVSGSKFHDGDSRVAAAATLSMAPATRLTGINQTMHPLLYTAEMQLAEATVYTVRLCSSYLP